MIKLSLIFMMALMGYIGYLCPYTPELFFFFISLFCLFSVVYVVYFGIFAEPEMSVYAYLFLWCFFPKGAIPRMSLLAHMDLPYMAGISLFSMMEIPAILAVLTAILTRKRIHLPRKFKLICGMFILTGIVSIVVSLFTPIPLNRVTTSDFFIRYLGLSPIFYSVIFLIGCLAFIREQKQVDRLLFIFFLVGVALTLEVIALKYLGLFRFLHHFSFHETGRFKSLLLNEYMGVGLLSVMAIISAVYFASSRGKSIFFLCAALFLLPLTAVHERAHFLALLLGLMFFVFLAVRPGYYKGALLSGMMSFLLLLIFWGDVIFCKIAYLLGGNIRPDYFSTQTFFSRIGIFLRAIEVVMYSFPFGVGPGGARHFMSGTLVPSYFIISNLPLNESISYGYNRLVVKGVSTGPHNLYLKFVAEYGLLGIITLGVFVFFILSMFYSFKRGMRAGQYRYGESSYLAQVCCYSMLISLGIYYFFTHDPLYYLIFFLLGCLIFILPNIGARDRGTGLCESVNVNDVDHSIHGEF